MGQGGYQILDFKNKELALGVGMIFDGMYDAIEATTKVLLISGLNLDGELVNDVFGSPTVEGSAFVFYLYFGSYGISLTIEDNDVVTYNEV